MSVTNPAALSALVKGDLDNFMVAATPGGIERQESAGQAALVASTNMPIEMRPSREAFEKIGFTFGEPVDELFVAATLPPGWTRAATGHSMHSDILDDKGRKRVSVFYKAAFYDRRADAGLLPRYSIDSYQHVDDEIRRVVVTDSDVALESFGEWQAPNYDSLRAIEAKARAWLDEHFPDHADPTAYWSDS